MFKSPISGFQAVLGQVTNVKAKDFESVWKLTKKKSLASGLLLSLLINKSENYVCASSDFGDK